VPAYRCEPSVLHLAVGGHPVLPGQPAIARLVAMHHWHRIIVVMPTTQPRGRGHRRVGRPGEGARAATRLL